MNRIHHVYRELGRVTRDGFSMGGGEPLPVLGQNGRPLVFEDLRSAEKAADRMNRENRRVGSDYVMNLTYFAGWRELQAQEGDLKKK